MQGTRMGVSFNEKGAQACSSPREGGSMKISAFIRDNIEAILQEWEQFADTSASKEMFGNIC